MGTILAVGGAKDGVGKTTFALHLAFGLAKASQKNICLVEADVSNIGDIKTYLNLKQNKTFVDFVKNSSRLDPKLAQNWIGKNSSGLYVLDAATFTTDFQGIDEASIDKSLKLLGRSFDYVILDVGRDFNPLSFRAYENASLIFVVSSSNVLAINQTAEYSKKLRSLHFGSEVQKIVINQFDPRGVVSAQVIKQKFNMEASVLLPDDAAAFNQCLAQAKPLQMVNPKHRYLKGIDDAIRLVSVLDSGKVEKSKVTRVGISQPIEILKQVLPFTFGDGSGGSNQKVLVAGATSKAVMDRNIAIRTRVHERLLELVDLREMDAVLMEKDPKKKEELRNKTTQAIQRLLEEEAKDIESRTDRAQLAKEIIDEALGLGPVEPLLENPEISEIMVNGRDQIFVERKGKLTLTDYRFTTDKQLLGCIERIVSPVGRRVDEKTPICDARLKDGSRINIIISPLSLKGPIITIRKFFKERLTINDLVKFNSLNDEMADFMRSAVEAHLNIIVSGGTGTGKTTLLNMVAGFIPDGERIVTVEDAAELQLPQAHVITLEARPANLQGEGAIQIRDLVRNALRMRPDRIVVGECRGGEALDMLQAMNTGHDGSLTTIHSNNPRDCLRRIETLVMMAGFDLPMQAIREQVASAVNLIVQLKRYSDGSRRISHITEVIGIEGDTVVTQPIFEFKQTGIDEKGKVKGHFQASGLIPKFVETLKAKGIAIPKGLFGGPKSSSSSNEVTPTKSMTPTNVSPAPSSKPPMPLRNPLSNPHGGKKS
jgi:pilus assembly protein CpaF